jgi:hypothetical protein
MKRSSARRRIRDRKRSDPPDEEYRVGPAAPRRSINSSPAKVAIRKARAENPSQLHPTSRLCSNERSVER